MRRLLANAPGISWNRIMPTSNVAELTHLIQTLQQERQDHITAIAEIDAAFASLGITATPAKKRGRQPSAAPVATAKPKGNRRRRSKAKDGMTGEQFLLSLLAKAKLSTADVNAKWKESGRKGAANNLLGLLVKDGRLKRQDVKSWRGSVYSAV